MSLRVCENCGESVDEAKAFCPGCGNPFVAEQRRAEDSEFEVSGSTMQFSKSAFNMVLSDMGLNISESPDRKPKQGTKVSLEPVVKPARSVPAKNPGISNTTKWILIAAAVGVVFIAILIVAAALAVYLYLKQP